PSNRDRYRLGRLAGLKGDRATVGPDRRHPPVVHPVWIERVAVHPGRIDGVPFGPERRLPRARINPVWVVGVTIGPGRLDIAPLRPERVHPVALAVGVAIDVVAVLPVTAVNRVSVDVIAVVPMTCLVAIADESALRPIARSRRAPVGRVPIDGDGLI